MAGPLCGQQGSSVRPGPRHECSVKGGCEPVIEPPTMRQRQKVAASCGGWPCFGRSESFRLSSISLIAAASRSNTFAGHGRLDVARCSNRQSVTATQFLGAMETLSVLPRRLPQPVQQSLRSTSSTLVCGRRPCCNSAAATWAHLRQAAVSPKATECLAFRGGEPCGQGEPWQAVLHCEWRSMS